MGFVILASYLFFLLTAFFSLNLPSKLTAHYIHPSSPTKLREYKPPPLPLPRLVCSYGAPPPPKYKFQPPPSPAKKRHKFRPPPSPAKKRYKFKPPPPPAKKRDNFKSPPLPFMPPLPPSRPPPKYSWPRKFNRNSPPPPF
ncbi:hypothetical protein E5676_scaffold63236G00010 [Cucumis melo var. makuwa]|uniref:Extensin-like n=2 Tax=Cucumis melo TaxID=3656 RepID=A0A5D3E2A1_CUCMM|nr:hypothetical protein E5676_scaffold63236G00010 [Cucumis melo var. makuwa]